jgi:predicted NBD/HSP70 family sugar kinase
VPCHVGQEPSGDLLEIQLQLVALDGEVLKHRFGVPARCAVEDGQAAARYLAACVNNTLMARGATAYTVSGARQVLQPACDAVDRHYRQVGQLTGMFQESAAHSPPGSAYDCRSWGSQPPHRPAASAIGINIGQSYIKAVVTTPAGDCAERLLRRTATESHDPATDIYASTAGAIRHLLDHAPDRVVAIGLSVGGIVRHGHIMPGSGVTSGLPDAGTRLIQSMGQRLERDFGYPVLTVQDAKAKAYFHSAHASLTRCLVVDLGTSLGGSYIDAAGRIPPYLNQFGRVACDLTPHAIPRSDGSGDGLLSQYVSAKGLMRMARAAGIDLTEPAELEDLLAVPTPPLLSLAGTFRHRLETALEILSRHYDARSVVITGGVLSGRFGRLVLGTAGTETLAGLAVLPSPEPVYDSCLGAAWAAGNHAVAADQTGQH